MKRINQSKPNDERIQRILNFKNGSIEFITPLTKSEITNNDDKIKQQNSIASRNAS